MCLAFPVSPSLRCSQRRLSLGAFSTSFKVHRDVRRLAPCAFARRRRSRCAWHLWPARLSATRQPSRPVPGAMSAH
eukprot:1499032-Pleurochrysis_carterae.AAC.1